MAGGVFMTCPRCNATRLFRIPGILYRCTACEWLFALTAQAPTGTSTAAVTSPPSSVTAITVASGGASFTAGMSVLYDTGGTPEVVAVGGGATATSIPIPAGFTRTHASGAAFGQVSIATAYPTAETVPPAPGWGF